MGMNEQDLLQMSRVLRHRLRNLASGIKSSVTFLSRELEGRLMPEDREYFPLILGECDALTDITSRMSLLFDDPPKGNAMSLGDVIRELAANLHEKFATGELSVGCDATAFKLRVKSDQMMAIPVRELVVNAIEAAPAKPVALFCAVEGGALQIKVRDQGSGAPPGDWEEWFRPFRTTKPRHLGIGLSIASRFAGSLGGAIKASRAQAGGLEFEASWPLHSIADG